MQMQMTPDEIETIKALIEDWGFEYSLKANRKKVAELAAKIGARLNFSLDEDDDE